MIKNKMAQEVTLVLDDSREVSFVGQAFCELPEDCYFEALKDPKNG